MKKEGYYSSGDFAKKAHVTLRTIRYYDAQNVLKPSGYTESGARLYTDEDLAKLQQILLLKYLGFSLDEIKIMTLASTDPHFLVESLQVQKKLVDSRIAKMKSVTEGIDRTIAAIEEGQQIDYNNMLHLIHLTSMEQSLSDQYQNATNISARIRLHQEYSTNPQGWFHWIYEQLDIQPGMKILEIGCGNGELWKENYEKLPQDISVVLSDISEGMVQEVEQQFSKDSRFVCKAMDAQSIAYENNTFDLIIANHVLFYCEDLSKVLSECQRVLKPRGRMIASTYGRKHMKEITELVQEYHPDIVLSQEALYEKFGLDEGQELLKPYFAEVEKRKYEDAIILNQAEPLISYILSCHGNQNQILMDHYKEFREFVLKKTENGFRITKDAGLFVCFK